MSRQLLDARIRAQEVIARADEILAKAADRREHIDWLMSLVRNGHPLPDTPEGQAEYARHFERLDWMEASRPVISDGQMEWDGIWRRTRG